MQSISDSLHIYAICLYTIETGIFVALSHRYKSIISVSWGGSSCDCFIQWCIVGILLLQRFYSVSLGMKAKSPSHIPPALRWGNYCCPHCCERLLTVKLFRYGANWATFPQRRFWCWKTVEIPHSCFIGISSNISSSYYQRHHAFFFQGVTSLLFVLLEKRHEIWAECVSSKMYVMTKYLI